MLNNTKITKVDESSRNPYDPIGPKLSKQQGNFNKTNPIEINDISLDLSSCLSLTGCEEQEKKIIKDDIDFGGFKNMNSNELLDLYCCNKISGDNLIKIFSSFPGEYIFDIFFKFDNKYSYFIEELLSNYSIKTNLLIKLSSKQKIEIFSKFDIHISNPIYQILKKYSIEEIEKVISINNLYNIMKNSFKYSSINDYYGDSSIIHLLFKKENFDLISSILKNFSENQIIEFLLMSDQNGWTPLHYIIKNMTYKDLIDDFFNKININVKNLFCKKMKKDFFFKKDIYKRSIIDYAIQNNQKDYLQKIFSQLSDEKRIHLLTQEDEYGWTSLESAAFWGWELKDLISHPNKKYMDLYNKYREKYFSVKRIENYNKCIDSLSKSPYFLDNQFKKEKNKTYEYFDYFLKLNEKIENNFKCKNPSLTEMEVAYILNSDMTVNFSLKDFEENFCFSKVPSLSKLDPKYFLCKQLDKRVSQEKKLFLIDEKKWLNRQPTVRYGAFNVECLLNGAAPFYGESYISFDIPSLANRVTITPRDSFLAYPNEVVNIKNLKYLDLADDRKKNIYKNIRGEPVLNESKELFIEFQVHGKMSYENAISFNMSSNRYLKFSQSEKLKLAEKIWNLIISRKDKRDKSGTILQGIKSINFIRRDAPYENNALNENNVSNETMEISFEEIKNMSDEDRKKFIYNTLEECSKNNKNIRIV